MKARDVGREYGCVGAASSRLGTNASSPLDWPLETERERGGGA